jgi:hypothetical protein
MEPRCEAALAELLHFSSETLWSRGFANTLSAKVAAARVAISPRNHKLNERKDCVAREWRHHERLEQPVLALGLATSTGQ